MRKTICALLIACLSACTLKPAPITSLDVAATVASLDGSARKEKIDELRTKIKERKEFLAEKKKSLDNVLTVMAIATLSPLTVGGTTYLIQLPARKAIKKERRSMAEKEVTLNELEGL